jgi:hypothetical protein
MVSRVGGNSRQRGTVARQLPITNFAHKAAVVGDDGVSALLVLATRIMPAEGRRAAALDGTHDLHLIEADVAGIGATPRRSVVVEDIRDLQHSARHDRGSLRRRLFLTSAGITAGLSERCLEQSPSVPLSSAAPPEPGHEE